ncbi:hypothetical protein L7H23_09970 [Sphingopyxis sp. BSN-002]|uniref:hypothetical protein n=1 Tax=Sphingopyxis sp. BSN-002 TaxID=2911495 RepID=UPI001EDA102F|nr:hypothetical protein [Sphingopyxis sp. BSN-002]UKK82898.1 hypothetical protein L7H23_09970 [Sphingopyxis sp. BSN-002]
MKRYAMALVAAVLLGGAASPSGLGLSTAQVDDFLTGGTYSSYKPQPLTRWDEEVRAALRAKKRDAAVAALASRYGLSEAQMTELVSLWVRSDSAAFDFVAAKPDPSAKAAIRQRMLALVGETGRSELVIEAAAVALDRIGECQAADFDALIAGATDRRRDAWLIANSAPCGGHFLRAARMGDTPFLPPLIRAADYGVLAPVDALALYAGLVSPEALARVADGDRDALHARLALRYAQELFNTGQADAAIALIDSRPAPVRALLRTGQIGAGTATVDGVPMTLDKEDNARATMLHLVSAYALAGRREDAAALFAEVGDRAAAERAFRCRWNSAAEGKASTTCREQEDRDWLGQMMLVQLLDHPGDDPYPLAETGFSGHVADGQSIPELACRIFDPAAFPDICPDAERSIVYATELDGEHYDAEEKKALSADLAALGLPVFVERRAAYDTALRAVVARLKPDDDIVRAERASVDPDPLPFAARPLPDAIRSAARRAPAWPKDAAALPPDFRPVRFEREGMRAAAISLSQNYDPVGEVSGGGYWLHLSDDGGRHWKAPLYTGLADRFPYVVPAEARMPLLAEDGAINLEVEVALLDTASITYPPVALATRRKESDLYLRLPIADLARDSDGDGFTDIAAQHLLLDRTGVGAPMLIGATKAETCGPMSNAQGARIALLAKLFDVHAAPIVEPLDMSGADIGQRMEKWGTATMGAARPIFLLGDPADFACLQSDQPIIVYSREHQSALAGKSPDFHPVTMPQIVFNRARDRGYVEWSAGWTGGTFRLRFEKNRWQIETIGSWIT